jgi:hypothetical protein
VLGIVGRNREAKIAGNATASAKIPPLTADLIRDALLALGLGSVNQGVKQDAKAIRFLSIVRDGAGFRADIDLPPGATAGQVAERRSQLASGLRRPMGCVWPEGDPDVHEGRLILYVADRSLSESKPAEWPLARKGTTNLFDPIPLGVDPRGRVVEASSAPSRAWARRSRCACCCSLAPWTRGWRSTRTTCAAAPTWRRWPRSRTTTAPATTPTTWPRCWPTCGRCRRR